jgi:hypothetical protein
LFALLDDGSLASRLEVMIVGGISMGLFLGVCFAFSAGLLADSVRADGFDNMWHWLTGRERKRVDFDPIARRIHEPAVTSLPRGRDTNLPGNLLHRLALPPSAPVGRARPAGPAT